jgi:hypothetical protein
MCKYREEIKRAFMRVLLSSVFTSRVSNVFSTFYPGHVSCTVEKVALIHCKACSNVLVHIVGKGRRSTPEISIRKLLWTVSFSGTSTKTIVSATLTNMTRTILLIEMLAVWSYNIMQPRQEKTAQRTLRKAMPIVPKI